MLAPLFLIPAQDRDVVVRDQLQEFVAVLVSVVANARPVFQQFTATCRAIFPAGQGAVHCRDKYRVRLRCRVAFPATKLRRCRDRHDGEEIGGSGIFFFAGLTLPSGTVGLFQRGEFPRVLYFDPNRAHGLVVDPDQIGGLPVGLLRLRHQQLGGQVALLLGGQMAAANV